ncbi:hypothetical protein SAMN04487957_10564 [Halomonas shengliensis]|uniref:DnaT DNA-binding domain-containing protein n=1 Tax=Halomonas shengliensis TaxID=419597 RepID=A0A1H0IC21_9GAMM|nr:DnaT-like ssDNA-binding domain-containing protein [Halomonas shengliensis]SDO29004.1 hypothetical protein SAMN04487957_10564 [Halomonas shengliensis]
MSHITAAMLPALLGRPVAYQPIFTRLPGVTVQGAIFLSQALFLTNTPTARARQGWFWKEQAGAVDSWESETGMSAKQQMTARRQLVALGVLQEQRKGVPAKTWYRVDTEALALALYQVLEPAESPANPHETPDSPVGRNCNLPNGETRDAQPECTESPDGSFLTETTTESNPPPSDARDVFERAAEQDDRGQPRGEYEARVAEARRQFPMTYGWQPEPEALAAACWRRGLPSNVTPTPATLANFTAHFAEKPEQRLTHQGWHERLAKWLDENRRKPQPGTGPTAAGDRHGHRTGSAGPRQRFSTLSAADARRLVEERRRSQVAGAPGGEVYDGAFDPGH